MLTTFTGSADGNPLFLFFTFSTLHTTTVSLHSSLLSFAPSVSSPHHFWLIRPGCQAVFTECQFVDYSPRNHVAQLHYQWLQRPHLLLRHLKNALFNQAISAKASPIPTHKETLLPSLRLLSLRHYCRLFCLFWGYWRTLHSTSKLLYSLSSSMVYIH